MRQIILAIFILLIAGFVWVVNASRSETKMFCTYNRVFIEFHDRSGVWGTIMLDDDGKPIPCSDDEVTEKKSKFKTKEII